MRTWGHALRCTEVPRGPGQGGKATQARVWLTHGDTPSLAWSAILSGTEKFNDYKGEFNYMLSLTSSGYNGTITHAFISKILAYIINQKQNVTFQWTLKISNGAVTQSRPAHKGVGEQSHEAPLLFRS